MSGQMQHVDMFRKLLLRRRLCSKAVEGAAYVPFVGDGDLAVSLYASRRIYAADLDPQRVRVAAERLPTATVVVADCNGWPFGAVDEPFAIADLDAYSNPYLSLTAFWANARRAHRVVVFGTDGMRQRIKRSKVTKVLPSGAETGADLAAARAQYNFWFPRVVRPYVEELVRPARIVDAAFYLRRDMCYWGMVIDA